MGDKTKEDPCVTDDPTIPTTVSGALEQIEGRSTRLRLVRPDDASYIHELRTNPAFNAHMSPVPGGVEEQRAWIERYKLREADCAELYYIVEQRRTRQPCGTVRLYDIGADSFTWGSWILDASKPPKAALESAVLSFQVGFDQLRKVVGRVEVRRENARAIAFYRRFGMNETSADTQNLHFECLPEHFWRAYDIWWAAIEAVDQEC